ncbi:MAG: bifunctional diaminohydroxyphosphoribosylaminopyrimidine deaminase/5-amino-6-(5-phosphoribosylamino)uracil reductase RibD [Actinomycetota bacterium]|nr:bifunctional diaminohydroxyphosphoribosylaminopyrimidine deaminase/5-amino-6-(5-phosphoribosylamino)uracil reductase RibD [Actinomycetota bacterium]
MERHEADMRRALELAERGWGRVSPNPLVGAVVRSANGDVIGEGWHEGPGTPHAEAMALALAGDDARGATVISTLEPCNRFGRTPPCTASLIDAGVARVVVGATDPDLGDGTPGIAELGRAGIEVVTDVLGPECRELNEAFEQHVLTGRPFVVLKSASSLDGKTAAADGTSRWITSDEARADAQRLRAWSDAIVVGSGTVIADDPSLTVRDERYADARPPRRVIVDSTGRTSAEARVFDASAPTLVATTDRAPHGRVSAWEVAGAEVVIVDRDEAGRVAIPGLLDALGKRDVQGMLVEGGARLAWGFVDAGLVDRFVFYLAPKVIGGEHAPGVVAGAGFVPVDAALGLAFERVERVGPDLKVVARVHRHR